MLTDCPECGTQVVAGDNCPLCGTPTPAPTLDAGAAEPRPIEPAAGSPAGPAGPPGSPGPGAAAGPGDTVARYANQWEVIFDRLRNAVAPKYEVTGILGYGGMAGVYLAAEPRLGRKVAIKVMSPGLMVDPHLVERFNQEARTIAQFNHPNIVTIYEVDERDGLHYFTMTYVAGRTLGQVMAGTEGPLPISVVRAWLYQIGDALAYAHHHGVVHRDVKPGNVLLDRRGNALVTDFGIAKVTDEPGLTRTGMLVGTPAYMSPEQCSSGKVEGASDQYSLGAVAYQMLTGQPPFAGPTLSVLQAHVGQEPAPIRGLRPDCPDDLVAAVQRMLEKKPEDRWPTMSAAMAGAGASAPGFDGPIREQIELLAAQAATVRVEPWFDVVREGSAEDLSATILDDRGRVLEGRRVDWRPGDALIASVTSGRLRAVSPGNTTIDAVCGGARTTLSLTVESDPVPSIEIEPAQVDVATGTRIPLDAIVNDWDGRRLEDRAVLWSSSDATVAKVSPEGVVEGIRPGEAVITAGTGGKSAAATVTVTARTSTTTGAPSESPGATLRPAGRVPQRAGRQSKTLTSSKTPAPAPKPPTERPARGGDSVGPAVPWQRKLLVPLTIVALVLTGIISIVVFTNHGGRTTGTVEIGGSLPAGAVVTAVARDGTRSAVDGNAVSLEPGSYTFEFSAPGHEASTSTVVVRTGQSVTWTPVIRESTVPASTGTLALAPDLPPDATITLTLPDGATRTITGPTPLEPGEYTVAFSAPGFDDVSGPVSIAADATTTFSPSLTPAAPPSPGTGMLRIVGNLPSGTTIRLRPDGGQARVVTGPTLALDPGRYTLDFSATGYEDDTGEIRVRAGQTATWTPDVRATRPEPPPPPTTGTLRIDRSNLPAGATITLKPENGAARPVSGGSLDLAPGSYALEFSAEGYQSFSGTVQVTAGGTARWVATVTAVPAPPPDNPPAHDPAADRAAIETAVRDFVGAFNSRNADVVVPLLPEQARTGWRALLTNTTAVVNFKAVLGSIESASLNGDQATVPFSVQVTYESGNAGQSSTLSYIGTARRAGGAWRLVSLRSGG